MLHVDLRFEAVLASADHGLQYLGPTLRGAFGRALKNAVCQMKHGECERCLLLDACPYPAIFDGRPPRHLREAWSSPALPQPFVLEVAPPDAWDGAATDLRWGLRLFGPAAAWSPYVVEAFLRMGRRGVGGKRTPFELVRVLDGITGEEVWQQGAETMTPPVPTALAGVAPPSPGPLRWRFETPLHVREESEERRDVDGLGLVVAGRRRWQLLERFYGDAVPRVPQPTQRRLAEREFTTLQSSLRPWGIVRFSGRQQRRVQLSGLVGEMVIDGPWHEAGPWLGVAAAIHLGKYSSFGFGRVTWERA